jgi:hypothetical protein
MRECFVVGSKLLGLYLLYSILKTLLDSKGPCVFFLRTSSNEFFPRESAVEVLLGSFFVVLLKIAGTFPFLFKAEWIANKDVPIFLVLQSPSDAIGLDG